MVRSPRFGSISSYFLALFRLGFPSPPHIICLSSQLTITRRLILQQERYHTIYSALSGCKLTVSGSISLSFSLFFSPFHHCTRSLSVISQYLALRDGPRWFRLGSSCHALLGILLWVHLISITWLSHSLAQLPSCIHLLNDFVTHCIILNLY